VARYLLKVFFELFSENPIYVLVIEAFTLINTKDTLQVKTHALNDELGINSVVHVIRELVLVLEHEAECLVYVFQHIRSKLLQDLESIHFP
jgi:hypothetical protein